MLGTGEIDELIEEYDRRAEELNDEDYKKIEVEPAEVNSIKYAQGVPGFWLKAMLNHPDIGKNVEERDRPLLMLL